MDFTTEEMQALRQWLDAIGFQGKAKELEKPLALHKSITTKLDKALADPKLEPTNGHALQRAAELQRAN